MFFHHPQSKHVFLNFITKLDQQQISKFNLSLFSPFPLKNLDKVTRHYGALLSDKEGIVTVISSFIFLNANDSEGMCTCLGSLCSRKTSFVRNFSY